jgi:dissimilatory sulfite reductase (desulfoviridin) alpha/beta subunit
MAVDYKVLKSGGFMPQKQKDHFSLRLKVVGGDLTVSQLRAIGQVAESYGSGHIHLTSRQAVEIPFIQLKDVENVKQALAVAGVEPGGAGPRVRTVTACQGSEVCPNGCVDTIELAQRIARRYADRILPTKFKIGITGCQNNCLKAEGNDLGVKGGYQVAWLAEDCSFCGLCAKGCRQKAIEIKKNRVAFKAELCNHCGRCVKSCLKKCWRGVPGYLMTFGGSYGNNIFSGERLFPLVSELEEVLISIDTALDFFAAQAQPGERFRLTIERVGWASLVKMLEDKLGIAVNRVDPPGSLESGPTGSARPGGDDPPRRPRQRRRATKAE